MLLPKNALLVKKNLTHLGCFSIFILHFRQTLEKKETSSVFSRRLYLKEKRYSKRRKSVANISNELLTSDKSVCIIKEGRFVLIRVHPQFWEDLENNCYSYKMGDFRSDPKINTYSRQQILVSDT